MSAGELLLVAAIVLLAIGFAALIVVLLRVHDTTTHLRREVTDLRDETRMLIWEGSATNEDGREVLKARATLKYPRKKPTPQ